MTGNELRQRREALALKQVALAPLLGRSARQLARWERYKAQEIPVTWLELAMWRVEISVPKACLRDDHENVMT